MMTGRLLPSRRLVSSRTLSLNVARLGGLAGACFLAGGAPLQAHCCSGRFGFGRLRLPLPAAAERRYVGQTRESNAERYAQLVASTGARRLRLA